jgi:methionyl-tRNA formyltransferase
LSAAAYTKLGFAGTPEFAAVIMRALCAAGRHPKIVLTQPDRGSGRGRKVVASPVKQAALERGIDVWQPASLKHEDAAAQLRDLQLDVLIVAAYGLLLPPAVLDAPRYGCVNVHASLLPRWRGAAPVQAAILAGDAASGITIMQMDAGLDTGPMLGKRTCTLKADDTAASLTDTLAQAGAACLLEVLDDGPEQLAPQAQDNAVATYAARIDKSVAELDFSRDAAILARSVRAYDPWPVAFTTLAGERLRIWHAQHIPGSLQAAPGTIVAVSAAGLDIATGDGTLRVLELQRAGGKRMGVAAYLSARAVNVGQTLGIEAPPGGAS